MKQILIAKRYASAAIESIPPEQYQDTLTQIKTLKTLLAQHPEILKIFSSTIIQKQKKIEFVNQIIETIDNPAFIAQIIKVLVLKQRENILEALLCELHKMLDEKLNQKTICITLAHTPDNDTIEKIKQSVEKTLNSKIVYEIQIDKNIIGGFIATTENIKIDAAVSSNLNRFVKTISKRKAL